MAESALVDVDVRDKEVVVVVRSPRVQRWHARQGKGGGEIGGV